MIIPLSPYVPENLVSRGGFSRPVPCQPAHLHTQAESGAYSRDSSRFSPRHPFINLNRHTSSGQSRVYWVVQLRTDGVHCRESAGTGPVVLKSVPVTGAAILQVTMDQLMCTSLFPHPLLVCMYVRMYGHHVKQSMDQPGKVANPVRGQLNREDEYSPVSVHA